MIGDDAILLAVDKQIILSATSKRFRTNDGILTNDAFVCYVFYFISVCGGDIKYSG